MDVIFGWRANTLGLGSRESGKSTVLKQMKIIHQGGFSDKERTDYRHIVYKNLTESAQNIVLAIRKLGLVLEIPIN
jgi:guanine nucleotide-binding protein G(i) subunit alpha